MMLNGEMKLRISLFREESRGMHFREDFPARNDDKFLAWIHVLKGKDGTMRVEKIPIPDKWRPPAGVPYEKRYVHRYPGELEYLKRIEDANRKD
jgi:hypothetical protein